MSTDSNDKESTTRRVLTGARGLIDVVKGSKRAKTGIKELKEAISGKKSSKD